MHNHDLYQVLLKRKSIRKYKMESIPSKTLAKIKEYGRNIEGLFPIPYQLEYVNSGDIKNLLFPVKAPHYVLIYCEPRENYLLNTGYILEKMDLFLSSIGVGACWLGMAKPTRTIQNQGNMEYVIMLAFGEAEVPLYRQNLSEFKRKNVSEISNCKEENNLVAALRFAPSASNGQPWYFQFNRDQNTLIFYLQKRNFFQDKLYGRFNLIDMGIASTFADIILKEQGKNPVFCIDPEDKIIEKKDYQYIITCRWNE